ncbi:uncharacterized protein [Procambarus clarkii]|uniref:uncharacterized protein n=1 Tax=Procambarus clarkii TaxID=6728 RepID=UPI001E677ED0|nr:uncharacterized protein LOC123746877 [Procambarus clarkii]XP_045584682.1 uncharacterized protein LOC123746877 [Procambarus clarkii]XP_045584683.1 uncharacterized protein LOC123746877 [Procambarus clarkii]XP_045584684.1 uncharacterized protein LOC123746877 [Procambarus clarkii]
MAFVLLPCDLPTWPTIQRHLHSLRGTSSPEHLSQVLYTLHSLCNVSIDPDMSEALPEEMFAGVEQFLRLEADPGFFSTTLPTMLDAALSLKELKPPQGLTYSLQQQGEDLVLERELASSLLAHIFFCTLPRRSPIFHPTLSDPCLAPTLSSLHRESQQVKVRALFHYFKMISQHAHPGHLTFSRKVMGSKDFITLREWARSEEPLCSVVIQHEGRLEDASPPALLTCFTSPDLARPALTRSNSQEVCAMLSQPELLVTAVLVERLEDNEAMQVSGALRTSTVSNLKTRPSFTPRKSVSPPEMVHVMMDADDYRQSEVMQYEEINVLRELNKARLAFTQDLPDPPANHSLSDIVSVSRQHSHGSASPPARYRTQVSSDSSTGGNQDEAGSSSPTEPSKKHLPSKGSTAEWVNESDTHVLKKKAKNKKVEIREKSKISGDEQLGDAKSKGLTTSKSKRGKNISKSGDKQKEKSTEKVHITIDDRLTKKHAEGVMTATQQESAGSASAGEHVSSFVTAPSTLRHRPKKPKGGRSKGPDGVSSPPPVTKPTGDKVEAKSAERVKFNVQETKGVVGNIIEKPEDQHAKFDEDEETTRLLNRVMRAIERLEQERPELVQKATMEEQVQNSNTISKVKGKPPLPESRPRTSTGVDPPEVGDPEGLRGEGSRRRRSSKDQCASGSRQGTQEGGQQPSSETNNRVGSAEDGRRLSLYYSCDSAPTAPQPEDDSYYSACESLDGQDVARPRRPSKKRGKKTRRKSSFADRLKEALARKSSLDSEQLDVTRAQRDHDTDDLHPRVSRQESGGFVLDDDLPRECSMEQEGERGDSDLSEDDGEAGRELGEENGSGSSRYSFSSDYISDLEDVYEQLGAVLEEQQEGQLGPRTAAIARFAHGLLKRALSESYKDVTLGLDGLAVRDPDSVGALLPRSLSLSEHRQPGARTLRPPPLHKLKGERGKPVVTGNWGCGSLRGDHQLKAMIQWAAASKAGAPKLIYYTYGHQNTVKLDIVCRLLGDRGWRVGDLVSTLMRYSESRLDSWRRRETELTESADSSLPESHRYRSPSLESLTLFDELIGADRPFIIMETEL